MIRIAAVVVIALLLGAAIVRNAVVGAWSATRPGAASQAWTGHPDVERTELMADVGGAARTGAGVSDAIRARSADLAVKLPLAVEPFLIAGVEANEAGDRARAQRLFEAAHRRDVRSLPAHFFLAEAYLRSNRVGDGLREIAHLGRLSPGDLGALPPYLAQYAKAPANWGPMRAVLAEHPELSDGILSTLAADPDNSAAILALADARHRNAKAAWLPIHVRALLDAGEYKRARAMWSAVVRPGAGSTGLIFDARFADALSPPPFNWELTSSSVGVADRRPGGSLEVIFYGSQGGTLARQLLTLGPGQYRLSMRVNGSIPDPQALTWIITCHNTQQQIAAFPMRKPGPQAWFFAISAGCPAQWLQLNGRAQDMNARAEITISDLALVPGGSGA